MIRKQLQPHPDKESLTPVDRGAAMLRLALELDRNIYRGVGLRTAVSRFRTLGSHEPVMLDALDAYAPSKTTFEQRWLRLRDLRPDMVLEKHVVSEDETLLILKQGTVLTETWIERLQNFAKVRGVREPVHVSVPIPGTSPE
jgi:hypothetical protein